MVNAEKTGRVDFHLHSYASNVTTFYAANLFSIPESYSDPIKLYHLLKRRGMTLVTLTDHNSIDGVLEMLHRGLPDVFISAEMTTTFPEDGCNIHITAANITERQFAEINRLRGNIYEMIAYLDAEIAAEGRGGGGNKLAYFMTHPFMSTGNRPYGREGALAIEHIEKVLLLCTCFEVRNGARTKALNELTLKMLDTLDAAYLERLASKHGLAAKGERPWRKAIVGGSDDHAGINPGRTFTEFPLVRGRPPTPNDLIESMRRCDTRPGGGHGGPITLAHSILKLLYDGSVRGRRGVPDVPGPKTVTVGGPLRSLLQLVFDSGAQPQSEKLVGYGKALYQKYLGRHLAERRSGGEPFEKILETEVQALLLDSSFRSELERKTNVDDRIFLVVGTLVNRIFARYAANLRRAGSRSLVEVIKEAVALAASNLCVSLPYFMSFLQQSSDCLITRDIRKAFHLAERQKLVLLTDTFFEINGVSASIRRMMREAERREIDLTVVTCLAAGEKDKPLHDPELRRYLHSGRLKIFTSVVDTELPEYDRLRVYCPPFLELLKYLQEEGFTKMQISTPGTIGLAGLVAAKLLQIETAATYHTAVPEYVENYTRDRSLEALAWKYVILFYHSVDEVLVPSKFVARLLHKRGLRNRKILTLDRWVDPERFHPHKRAPDYFAKHGLAGGDKLVKFVYVGRLGIEKNLQTLAEAYRKLCALRQDIHLFLIGDGPYRRELEKQLVGLPVTFLGFVTGDELPRAIASADVKLFPSTTDTWGNAPLEAQSCGLPVVVSDVGGPVELIIDGVTGFKVRGRDVQSLYEAMVRLLDAETRARMGRSAREFVERNRVDEPFTAILDSDAYRRRLAEAASAARDAKSASGELVVESPLPLVSMQLFDLTSPRFSLDGPPLGESL